MKLGRLKKLFTKSTLRKSKRNQGGELQGAEKEKKIENQIAFLTPKTFFLKTLYYMKLGRLKKLFTKSTLRISKKIMGGKIQGAQNLFF